MPGCVALVEEFAPDAIAIERVFSQHNVRTRHGHGPGRGHGPADRRPAGIPVALHTPTEVKAAVTGSGRADKAQVTTMVTRLLRLPGPPRPPTPPMRSRSRSARSGAGRRSAGSAHAVAAAAR